MRLTSNDTEDGFPLGRRTSLRKVKVQETSPPTPPSVCGGPRFPALTVLRGRRCRGTPCWKSCACQGGKGFFSVSRLNPRELQPRGEREAAPGRRLLGRGWALRTSRPLNPTSPASRASVRLTRSVAEEPQTRGKQSERV